MSHVLAIDQGTTSTRALLFDADMVVQDSAQEELTQYYPNPGWVEHDAEEIWQTTVQVARAAMSQVATADDIAGIGITNQRETVVVWEKDTGKPLHKAIVWQDRRTARMCEALRDGGHEPMVTQVTGLLLDPYFSATKIKWILDTYPGSRARAAKGEILFGTIETWLIWRLTGGKVHATDATNAARTMLCDIRSGTWSAEICELLEIPMQMLPEIRDCAGDFGTTEDRLFGGPIAIRGSAGDQQAATLGQACFTPGMMKSTYGTGCFALLNTGTEPVMSRNRLLTTIAYQLGGKRTYALEGSIFIAGAVVQWLRDEMGLIEKAEDVGPLALKADAAQDLIVVPAFTGLGAPYWDPDCRGAIFGMARNSGPAEFARAALEAVAFQTRDLWEAMQADWSGARETVLRVDGGMSVSDVAMQGLADILGAPVDRPVLPETTALGAAWLAGMQAGIWPDQEGFAASWRLDRQFTPETDESVRAARYARWQKAVAAAQSVPPPV